MTLDRLRWKPSATTFIALAAAGNALLYHLPLFSYAADQHEVGSLSGVLSLVSALVALFASTALVLSLLTLLSHRVLKPFSERCLASAQSAKPVKQPFRNLAPPM